MSQNHRRAAPAIDPTKKSSLFEVPLRLDLFVRQIVKRLQHQHPKLAFVEELTSVIGHADRRGIR
jgi:hypothetical protein